MRRVSWKVLLVVSCTVGAALVPARVAPAAPAIGGSRTPDTPTDLAARRVPGLSLGVDGNAAPYSESAIPVPTPSSSDLRRAAAPEATAALPPSETFRLHSKPGADRTIHLDFDGFLISGTAWMGGKTCYAPPYDTDGDTATVSQSEHADIQTAWAMIAEDYAPFDLDVTTEEPPAGALERSSVSDTVFGTRALFTDGETVCPDGTTLRAATCGGCGGMAYTGVFGWIYAQPALVFTLAWAGPTWLAEAGSHELGHNAGLSHDAWLDASDPSNSDSPVWGPILGGGFRNQIVQFSRGEYRNANNLEDDFAVAAAQAAPIRADDHGDTSFGATPLVPGTPATGIIATRTDVDAFSFTTTGGTYAFAATPASPSPNLDIALTIDDATGRRITFVDPPSMDPSGTTYIASGMGATTDVDLPAGTYVVRIDGVGWGDPVTNGYSDYGSVGAYTLAVNQTRAPQPGDFTKTAPDRGARKSDPSSLTLSWAPSPGATGYEYCIDNTSGSVCTTSWVSVGPNTSITLTNLVGAKAYFWQVRAVNAVGTTYANANTWWYFKTIAAPSAFGKKTPSNGVTISNATAGLTWGASSRASYYEYCIDTINNNSCDTGWISTGGSRSKSIAGLSRGTTYYWHVRAVNGAGTRYANSDTWWRFTA